MLESGADKGAVVDADGGTGEVLEWQSDGGSAIALRGKNVVQVVKCGGVKAAEKNNTTLDWRKINAGAGGLPVVAFVDGNKGNLDAAGVGLRGDGGEMCRVGVVFVNGYWENNGDMGGRSPPGDRRIRGVIRRTGACAVASNESAECATPLNEPLAHEPVECGADGGL